MSDMEQDLFADTNYGKAALERMRPLPDDFRLFEAGWLGDKPAEWNFFMVRGAQFRKAKSGPRLGKLAIKVKGTDRTVYFTKEEMEAFR